MKVFAYLQKLGRSLMLPVAVLPAAALFLRFGSADLLGKYLGGNDNVLREAGLIAFQYMPLIFAAGVAIGISDDGHGTAVLSAILAFYTLNQVGAQWAKMFYGAVPESWDIGTLGGVIAGVIAGETYNKYKNIKLPDIFAFFAAKRFVPMATLFFSVLIAIVFGGIWPTFQNGIASFYTSVASLPKPGQTFVYITTERLLIPFGLHHILNALFIFDAQFGDSIRFFKGMPGAGYIMAGAYPLKMFILPGLAAAFVVTAKKQNKKSNYCYYAFRSPCYILNRYYRTNWIYILIFSTSFIYCLFTMSWTMRFNCYIYRSPSRLWILSWSNGLPTKLWYCH